MPPRFCAGRGTGDGLAYVPEPREDLWPSLDTTLEDGLVAMTPSSTCARLSTTAVTSAATAANRISCRRRGDRRPDPGSLGQPPQTVIVDPSEALL